jgi:hypothetical protein
MYILNTYTYLDKLKLSAALELEALELSQRSVEVENGVPLLEPLAFLLSRRQNHGLVWAVELEQN